jgi:hypothetical protein
MKVRHELTNLHHVLKPLRHGEAVISQNIVDGDGGTTPCANLHFINVLFICEGSRRSNEEHVRVIDLDEMPECISMDFQLFKIHFDSILIDISLFI